MNEMDQLTGLDRPGFRTCIRMCGTVGDAVEKALWALVPLEADLRDPLEEKEPGSGEGFREHIEGIDMCLQRIRLLERNLVFSLEAYDRMEDGVLSQLRPAEAEEHR